MSAQWIYTGIILSVVGALMLSISLHVDNLYADRGLKALGIGVGLLGVVALLIGVWT